MPFLAALVRFASALNSLIGRVFAWATLAVVLICFAVVVLRYGFDTGEVWMQDLYVWLHGAIFVAVAGQVLLRDGHVRVDIFYRPAGVRAKAWVDLVGTLVFLLPFVAVVAIWSWPYVVQSWEIGESSKNTGGMPGLWVLKTFLIAFAVLLGLQGLAVAARSVLILVGRPELLPAEQRPAGA